MTGKVISIQNNELIFNFMGNELKISTNEIASIVFTESIPVRTKSDFGTLTGVVTYFFNDNYGDKPDVGAKIIVCKYKEGESFLKQFREYNTARHYRVMMSYLKKNDTKRHEYLQKLADMGIYTDEDFDKLDKDTSSGLINLTVTESSNFKNLTVDGTGKYSIQLPVGKYEVIFQSKILPGPGYL